MLYNQTVYSKIIDIDNLYKALQKVKRDSYIQNNNTHLLNSIKPNYYYDYNIYKLWYDLFTHNYKFSHYREFRIIDSRTRIIHAPSYRDKIIQHAINTVLQDIYKNKWIRDSYACIPNRGMHMAIKRLKYFRRRAEKQYTNPRLIKIDISKFFYTINHYVLLNILEEDLQDTSITPIVRDMLTGYKKSINNSKFQHLLEYKFLEPHCGLPLGNLTSQLFGNVVLNRLDHFVKRYLKVKYYLRFADDVFIIVEEYRSKFVFDQVVNFLHYKLKLNINPKKCYISKIKNIHGLGCKITKNTIRLLKKNRHSLNTYLKNLNIYNIESTFRSLNSWNGYARICNSHRLINSRIRFYHKEHLLYYTNKFVLV